MRVLLTGATGFLGRYLLPLLLERGDTVVALYRQRLPPEHKRIIPVRADISRDGEWEMQVGKIDAVYHLAGLIELSTAHRRETWQTNVEGTRRVIKAAFMGEASHFYHVGTAFTQDRNPYEVSKRIAEEEVERFGRVHGVAVTIFKPSVIVGHTVELVAEDTQGLYQIVKRIAWAHRRLEVLRRWVEGTLRLPPVELSFRIPGKPDAQLDIVPVDWVAEMVATTRGPGVFWLTNPNSPTLQELAEWVGELLWLDIKFLPGFKASLVELAFQRAARSGLPYFSGESVFTPSLDGCPKVGKEFIQKTVLSTLLPTLPG